MSTQANWKFFRIILLLITSGLLLELLLIEHFEDPRQLIPVVVLGLSLIFLPAIVLFKSLKLYKIFLGLMLLCVGSGILGIYFHLEGNFAFEREMYPTRSTADLLLKSIRGATPLLAPGSMIGLGLLGIFYIKTKI